MTKKTTNQAVKKAAKKTILSKKDMEQQKERDERLAQFDKAMSKLFKKYHVSLGVRLEPANELTESLRDKLSINWSITMVDTKGTE